MPGCVIVLATDFDVIKQGIEAKYPIMDTAKRRQFFEKIIQVPFVLPASQYPIESYVLSLTQKQRPNSSDNEAFKNTVVQLINLLLGKQSSSASSSPRQIKRAFNRYGLYHSLLSAPESMKNTSLPKWTISAELELFAMQLIQMVDETDSSEGEVTRYTVLVKSICDSKEVDEESLKELFHEQFKEHSDISESDAGQTDNDAGTAGATDGEAEAPNVGDQLLEALGLARNSVNEGKPITDGQKKNIDEFVTLIEALGFYANTENTDTTLRGRLENLYPTIWDILQRHCPRCESDSKRLGDGGHLQFYIGPDDQDPACMVGYGLPREGRPSWFSFVFYNLTKDQLIRLEQLRNRKFDTVIVRPVTPRRKGNYVTIKLSNRPDGDHQVVDALAKTIEQLLDAAPIQQNPSPNDLPSGD